MKNLRYLLALCLIGSALSVLADRIKIVECIDAEGNSSFRDICPIGWPKKGERTVQVAVHREPTLAELAKQNPVTVYFVPNCDACDLVRSQLETRGIPFEETDVSDNPEAQKELNEHAGALSVPTVLVGKEVFTGYHRSILETALTNAGYPLPASTE